MSTCLHENRGIRLANTGWWRDLRLGGRALRVVWCFGQLPAVGEPITQDFGRGFSVVGQTREKIVDVGEGVYAVPVTGGGYAEEDRRRLGTAVAPGKQPILAANGNVPQCQLGQVVVDVQEAIFEITRERLPVPKGVGNGLADRTFGQHFRLLRLQPLT